jgi:hypothetical protein
MHSGCLRLAGKSGRVTMGGALPSVDCDWLWTCHCGRSLVDHGLWLALKKVASGEVGCVIMWKKPRVCVIVNCLNMKWLYHISLPCKCNNQKRISYTCMILKALQLPGLISTIWYHDLPLGLWVVDQTTLKIWGRQQEMLGFHNYSATLVITRFCFMNETAVIDDK